MLVQRVAMGKGGSPAHETAMAALRQALAGNGWLQLADEAGGAAFHVRVNEAGEFEIGDMAGQPLPNLRPAIQATPDAAAQVVQRLAHLARYHAILRLRNPAPRSPLAHQLSVALLGRARDHDPAGPFTPEHTFDEQGNVPTLAVGDWTALRLHNRSSAALNVTVLDLQPDWGITQIIPGSPSQHHITLNPGQARQIVFQAALPPGYTEGSDLLKVFATRSTTNFRWLTLPSLDQPPHTPRDLSLLARGPQNDLEQLLATLTADAPPPPPAATPPTLDWTTEQLLLHIRAAR